MSHDVQLPRRTVLTGGAGLAAVAGLTACDRGPAEPAPAAPAAPVAHPVTMTTSPPAPPTTSAPARKERELRKLAPGEAPPQFVVISWDGAAEMPSAQLTRFRNVAKDVGASMTLFLTGIYLIPEKLSKEYKPPRRAPGTSDISFLTEASVRRTIQGIGEAWQEGHEIGTHFNGHFCGPRGVAAFTSADWRQEIEEAKRFVRDWKSLTGYTDLPDFPFDYDKELVGSRTPCLEGRARLLPVARELGWRYDTSGTRTQNWPVKDQGLWDMSMASLPFRGREVISMDYNYMYVLNKAKTEAGTAAERAKWQGEVLDSYRAGFNRVYNGNRAPLIIGNHFEQWNGGIYMNAVEAAMRELSQKPGVQFVSHKQLCDWMDMQDPAVIAALQALPTTQQPKGGWESFMVKPTPTSTPTSAKASATTAS